MVLFGDYVFYTIIIVIVSLLICSVYNDLKNPIPPPDPANYWDEMVYV
uniref:Uncharacterized protein n=1 Tax=Abalone asfa-like virus TaxID=2839893 RepID=A0A5K7Y7R9_9VIRU|nr:hypothetical protein [Abalone asfa-like virus]